eukprot:144053-Hanusia_phi.AAC.11
MRGQRRLRGVTCRGVAGMRRGGGEGRGSQARGKGEGCCRCSCWPEDVLFAQVVWDRWGEGLEDRWWIRVQTLRGRRCLEREELVHLL